MIELNSYLFGKDNPEQIKTLNILGDLRDMPENGRKERFVKALIAVTKKERRLSSCLTEAYDYRNAFSENTLGWRKADELCVRLEDK